MYAGKIIFSQLMNHLPWRYFRSCVQRYSGDYKIKKFTCADQFRVMAFAQLTYRESLRDIEACLRAMSSKLYHMGIRGNVSRNNLAHANETRELRITIVDESKEPKIRLGIAGRDSEGRYKIGNLKIVRRN